MMDVVTFFRLWNALLAAAIGITAAGLWLYTLTFNLQDRVARTFSLVLLTTIPLYGGEALADVAETVAAQAFWMRVSWTGLAFLPAVLLAFSHALLDLTGRPSRGRRIWAVRAGWLAAAILALGIWVPLPWSPGAFRNLPAPHFRGGWWAVPMVVYYLVAGGFAGVNIYRAYQRTVVQATRRRMLYLLLGTLALAVGSFPYLTFGEGLLGHRLTLFWFLGLVDQIFVGGLLTLMAYAASFFGVTQPDRIVQQRLIRWLIRGPVTVSITLGALTLVRRWAYTYFGQPYGLWVPVTLVTVLLALNALWGVVFPWLDRFIQGHDPALTLLYQLERGLFTSQDIRQFLEALLGVLCERLKVEKALLAALQNGHPTLWVTVGEWEDLPEPALQTMQPREEGAARPQPWVWDGFLLWPLHEQGNLVGVLVFPRPQTWDEDARAVVEAVSARALLALRTWQRGQQALRLLHEVAQPNDMLPRLRALARFNQAQALREDVESLPAPQDVVQWVWDALKHYWGGPKLTRNPLLRWRVVRQAAAAHNGDPVQGLRAVLREAVERLRPPGERRFTTEWLLYNILEMRFFQGRKVRDIARRLALSEADYYRKQRVALEEVVRVLIEMEKAFQKATEAEAERELHKTFWYPEGTSSPEDSDASG